MDLITLPRGDPDGDRVGDPDWPPTESDEDADHRYECECDRADRAIDRLKEERNGV